MRAGLPELDKRHRMRMVSFGQVSKSVEEKTLLEEAFLPKLALAVSPSPESTGKKDRDARKVFYEATKSAFDTCRLRRSVGKLGVA